MKKIVFLFIVPLLAFSGCAGQTQTSVQVQAPQQRSQNAVVSIVAPGATQQTQQAQNLDISDVRYFLGHEKVKGYLAMPKEAKNLPAVILIHEWWGLNDNMKEFARSFAEQGYVALAVDLYEGQSTADSAVAQTLASSVRDNMDGAFENLKAAVFYLQSLPQVDKTKLASVGWCFGGGWAYQMAKNDMGVRATVMYYGQFSEKDDLSHMKATILGHFGDKDAVIKIDDVKQFQATLRTLSGNHEIYIYPNAGHGFANSSNPAYDKSAADLAWRRTMTFLAQFLKQ